MEHNIMLNANNVRIKRKMLGVLIRNARLLAGFNIKETATMLGIPPSLLSDYEFGLKEAGLPILEALARICDIPISYFWSENPFPEPDTKYPTHKAIPIRRKMLGVLLSKTRTEAGHSIEQVAKFLGCSPSLITQYEFGEVDIPFSQLTALAELLKVDIEHFLVPSEADIGSNGNIPISTESIDLGAVTEISGIPEDVVEFLQDPSNILYLKLAMRLQGLSSETLRTLAEGILDITY